MINWFNHLYPYTNIHELNLDWLIGQVKENEEYIKNFVGSSVIKYAVPIQWDITRQYERNTVVIDSTTGDAYVSIAPVPVGFDLSHTEYWMKIFTLGNQIAVLESQIATNEGNSTRATQNYSEGRLVWINDILYITTENIDNGDLFDVGNNIEQTTIESVLDTIRNNIATNTSAINVNADEISNLKNTKQTNLANRKFLFVCDSYGLYGWADGILNRLNVQGHVISAGGAGFHGATGGVTFLDALTSYTNTIDDDEKQSYTDIIIGGGVNDMSSTTTQIENAIDTFITYANTNYPNAKIGCGCISWVNRGNDVALYTGTVIPTYCAKFSKLPGCYYIPNAYLPMHNYDNIASDGIHPTTNGAECITDFFCNYLQTGNADYIVINSPTVTPANGTGSFTMNTTMDKSGVDVVLLLGTYTFTTPKELSSYDTIQTIATITGGCFHGMVQTVGDVQSIGTVSIPVACKISTASVTYDGTVMLTFYDGKIDVSGIKISAQSTYVTATALTFQPISFHAGLLIS